MTLQLETITSSPNTADGFFVSVFVLLGTIVMMFLLMRKRLKGKSNKNEKSGED